MGLPPPTTSRSSAIKTPPLPPAPTAASTFGITPPSQSDALNPPKAPVNPMQTAANQFYPEIDYPATPKYYSNTCTIAQTNAVVPAEVCTIDQLSYLGLYDDLNYIKSSDTNFTDLKTFNADIDNKENRTKAICKKNLKGDRANLNCLFEHGAGYIRKPGDPDTCMVYDCPPGFERSGNDCKKILLDAKVDKRARCDERWSDWFMIPNYHLGNKFQSTEKGGICYAPCGSHEVPNYAIDPVDGAKIDFSSSDKIDKCVARNIYFGGKYGEGSEHCPLSWIHKLTATPDSLNTTYTDILKSSGSNVTHNDLYNTVMTNSKNLMTNMLNDVPLVIEDVTLSTPEMEIACANLYTTDRVKYAYGQCKALKDNEESYKANLAKTDTSGALDQKLIMIKQSCNALFCPKTAESDDTTFMLINKDKEKDKICFSSIGNVDPSKVEKKKDKDGNEIYPDDEAPPSASDGESLVYTALAMFAYLIIIPIGMLLFYYFLKYAGPFSRDVFGLIVRLITYICQYALYILSFTAYDIREINGFFIVDEIKPGKVNEFATKYEAEHIGDLPKNGADYGRTHPSWRLYSRKWTN